MALSKQRRILSLIVAVAMLFGLLGDPHTQRTDAAVAAQFDPGLIIDDALFYQADAMTLGDIQSFLAEKGSYLATYAENTTTKPAGAYSDGGNASGWGVCSQYDGAANESAAAIIYKVQVACGVSAKVLLATLQKESSLVTSGTSANLRSAMGYACPDTAACASLYYGFFNQMFGAARSFQWYGNALPGPHSTKKYAVGTWTLGYKANTPACGSQTVFVHNRATAALYYYTPYVPNAAALSNLYGVGDVCSSYGNRNFWRIYTDWFGSTRAGSLMRTALDPTVYLMGDGVKYPIDSLDILTAYLPLGPVTVVSQSYLNTYTTGPIATRIVRDATGTLYFVDSGIKLPFSSCESVTDYGSTCAGGFMQLTNLQVSRFSTGPAITSLVRTSSGTRYFINDGVRHEVIDDAPLLMAGIQLGVNTISDESVRQFPLAEPLTSESTVVFSPSGGYLLSEGKRYALGGTDVFTLGLMKLFTGYLTQESLSRIDDGGRFSGTVVVDGETYVLSAAGLIEATTSTVFAEREGVPLTQEAAVKLGFAGELVAGSFVKSESSGTVFLLDENDVKPIGAWESLLALTPSGQGPTIHLVPQQLIEAVPKGVIALTSGSLYRDDRNATVYLVNGVQNKIPLASFSISSALGFRSFSFTSTERLEAYPVSSSLLSFGVKCGNKKFLGVEGALREVPISKEANFPISYVEFDSYLCSKMTFGASVGDFIRTPDGTIYALRNGKKIPILSMVAFVAQANGQPWMNVERLFADQIPNG